MSLTITRAVETCAACPSQWDAWDQDGRYYYLRYRFGRGTVQAGGADGPVVAEFGENSMDGCIELEEFCAEAGITLAEAASVTSYAEHFDEELRSL